MSNQNNASAWAKEHFDAWVRRFGTPEAYAEKIKKEPNSILGPLSAYFVNVNQKKIINLMGSNGNKAVALSLLGAKVTVVDFSESNKTYAMALAKEAGVEIEYLVSDILALSMKESYDLAFAEMGILHYFTDLSVFFSTIYNVLNLGGECLIRDFHPISTKLISSRGSTAKVRKHKVDGDYFSDALFEKEVSYGKYGEDEPEKVYLRLWTLGEIITAAAHAGFVVAELKEEPNQSSDVFDKGIPKTFVLKLLKGRRD
mgnify:CR=1 FL=1